MTKIHLALSPPLADLQREAEAIGVSLPSLMTADLVRYRVLADAATPDLTKWEWTLLTHVMDGVEAHRVLSGDDSLPSGRSIAAMIEEWCDDAAYDQTLKADALRKRALEWQPLTVAGILMRLRDD